MVEKFLLVLLFGMCVLLPIGIYIGYRYGYKAGAKDMWRYQNEEPLETPEFDECEDIDIAMSDEVRDAKKNHYDWLAGEDYDDEEEEEQDEQPATKIRHGSGE